MVQAQGQPNVLQLTFYYNNGESETYSVYEISDPQNFTPDQKIEFRHLLGKEWWVLHLPEETVLINLANVLKVEVKPPKTDITGDDVFYQAYRMTALNRATRV